MLTVRKIDLIAQAVIGGLSLLSLVSGSAYVCLMGEILIGAWQVISALLNSVSMMQSTYRARIKLYWILTVSALLLLLIPDLLEAVLVASWGIAIYYWFVYRSFLNYLSHRKELATIVRHH